MKHDADRKAPPIELRKRLAVSAGIGLSCAICCWFLLTLQDAGAADFKWALRGVRLLLQGTDPYTAPGYYANQPLFYPLPALFATLPFAALPDSVAAACFFGVSCALLAWGLFPKNGHRLLVFLSAPFFGAIVLAQWSPLLMAACVVPWLLPLIVCKPNLGLIALTQNQLHRLTLAAAAALVLFSLIVLPAWPLEWWHNIRIYQPATPMLPWLRAVLLLGFLRWREPEGRLLGMLALVPLQPYDAIILWLIPKTLRQCLTLTLLSWAAFVLWQIQPTQSPLIFAFLLYLPALAMTLKDIDD